MRPGREFALKLESAFPCKLKRLRFRDDVTFHRAQAPKRFRPINNSKPSRGFEYSPRLGEDCGFVLDLEQQIRDEHEVERFIRELRSIGAFEVGPDDIDILESAPVCFIFDATKKVALHVYRVHMTGILKCLCDVEHVDTATRAEVGNRHPRFNAERRNIAPRVREIRRIQRSHCVHYIAPPPKRYPQLFKSGIYGFTKPIYDGRMELYHVFNLGVERRTIFMDQKDYIRFVHDLYEFNDAKPALNVNYSFRKNMDLRNPYIRDRDLIVDIHAWCLMKNHYHLLLSERVEGGLTMFLRKLNVGYANYFNEKYRRSGSLFQGRTKKAHINSEAYFLHIGNYIHFNPLDYFSAGREWRTRTLTHPSKAHAYLMKYRWSSYPGTSSGTHVLL